MVVKLDGLPPELYEAIIQFFEPEDIQQSLLALTRAVPFARIPQHQLFYDIALKHPQQVFALYRRLRKAPQDGEYVRTFAVRFWTIDPNVLANLLALLPNVHSLTIFVGTTFSPEDLDDLFKKPRPLLKFLSLRFKPYVERATYYQFLKGAYFDSFLLKLADWPRAEIPVVSIIQDPLDPTIAPTQKFAQPLVFFRLEPISTLTSSPYISTVRHFRFRIPGRDVARFLIQNPQSLPTVELLDIATCRVNSSELQRILARLPKLKYLNLDQCPVVTQRADALEAPGAEDYSQWAALGQALATMGLEFARSREKEVKEWLEAQTLQEDSGAGATPVARSTSKARKRDKVAMSPFTLRGPSKPAALDTSVATKSVTSTSSKSASTSPKGAASSSSQPQPSKKRPKPNVRVLPPVPMLKHITLTAPMLSVDHPSFSKRCDAARAAFELGWAEGLATLVKKRALIRISWGNGARAMSMSPVPIGGDEKVDDHPDGEVFNGLDDIKEKTDFDVLDERSPQLCLAGPSREGEHVDGCPHSVSWEAFKDEL